MNIGSVVKSGRTVRCRLDPERYADKMRVTFGNEAAREICVLLPCDASADV